MRRSDDRIGLKSGWFLTVIPYSVSIPITFGIAMVPPEQLVVRETNGGRAPLRSLPPGRLQVLAGVDDPLDGPLLFLGLTHQGLDVDDALALLAGDLGPIVRIGRVGEILVLLELLAHRAHHVVEVDALLARLDVALQGQLLGPPHHRLDHGSRGEVLEVQNLLVTVGVGHLEEAVFLAEVVHLLHRRSDHALDGRLDVAAVLAQLGVVDGQLRRQVLLEDVHGGGGVRTLDLDLHVEAAGTKDGRVDEVLAIRGAHHDDVAQMLHPVDLREELRDDGGLDVGGDAGAAGAEQRVHLVEEHNDRHVLGGLLAGLDEDLADLSLRLAHVLVQKLGALDVEEVALDLLAPLLGDLLGEVVGHGLGDHGLATARRAVEEHALGWAQLVLAVVVGVEVGQLYRVLDGFDLGGEATDVLVVDVGDFLEGEIFHLALGQLLEEVAALAVHEDVVADLELDRAERVGHDADLVLVGAKGDDGAALLQHLLEDDHITLDLIACRLDDIQAFIEDQLLARLEGLCLDRGMQVHLHLAPLGEDVDRRVLVHGEIHTVRGGRRAELVDFLLQRGDLLPRLVEGVDELLVLIESLNELAIGFAQLVLEDHELLRRVLELLPQAAGLGFEGVHVGLKVLDLYFVLGQPATVIRIRHR